MNGKLIVSEGGRDRVHELCDEHTVVGTGNEADLHLRQPEIAPAHCDIKLTPAGYKLVDLETTTGTTVNGQVVNQHLLQNGDTIQLGKVRITFLGDSAQPPERPRSAPPKPLTAQPKDKEGRPRHFYRHESRNELQTGPKVALILACLGVAALILIWLGKSVPNAEGRQQFTQAQELLKKDNVTAIKQALALLDNLPPGTVKELRLDEIKDQAKGRLFELEQARSDRASAVEFQRILEYHLSHPEDAGYLRSQIPIFRSQYPDSPHLSDLEQRLQAAAAGGAGKIAAWEAAEDALRGFIADEDFKKAFAVLGQLEADDHHSRSRGPRIATYRAALERRFEKHFTKMKQRALDLHQKGQIDQARAIYENLAAVQCEPYSSQAKLLAAKLQ